MKKLKHLITPKLQTPSSPKHPGTEEGKIPIIRSRAKLRMSTEHVHKTFLRGQTAHWSQSGHHLEHLFTTPHLGDEWSTSLQIRPRVGYPIDKKRLSIINKNAN